MFVVSEALLCYGRGVGSITQHPVLIRLDFLLLITPPHVIKNFNFFSVCMKTRRLKFASLPFVCLKFYFALRQSLMFPKPPSDCLWTKLLLRVASNFWFSCLFFWSNNRFVGLCRSCTHFEQCWNWAGLHACSASTPNWAALLALFCVVREGCALCALAEFV